jgi:hypothetical protein
MSRIWNIIEEAVGGRLDNSIPSVAPILSDRMANALPPKDTTLLFVWPLDRPTPHYHFCNYLRITFMMLLEPSS